MKQRKRWLGLAFAPFALAMFALAQPAHAADYTGNCALMPNHVTGDANVNDSACIISSDLTVDGSLTINATSVDAKNINAGGNITINTSSGNIKTFQLINAAGDIKVASGTGDVETRKISAGTSVQVTAGLAGGVTSKIVVTQPIVINKTQDTEGHGNVILRARGNISTSTIRTDGELGAASLKAGAIQIDSNLAGGSTEFVIGGSGAANGVNGSIITRTTVGGGTDTIYTFHGVRITNGGFNSTGGITVTSMANIQVTATQSRAGWIELNAQNGILKLPSGKLNAEGANPLGTDPGPSYTGGAIYLLAKEIQTESGTIISARQAPGATPTLHQIALATETVTLKGENGLRILNDGDGVPESFGTIMVPQFGLTPTSNNNLNDLKWGFLGDLSLSTHKTLLVNGISDRSPFRLSSDGSNQGVAISGYPLAFKTGVLDISARGSENHKIKLGYFGVPDGGSLGVQIDTTLTATIDASGKDGNGGVLDIAGDGFDILHTPLLRLLATGPSSGDGDGGQVKIKVNDITLSSTPETKVQIDGSAATAGSGNAIVSELSSDDPQAIKIETAANTSLIFGSAKGMFSLQANGGFVGGNAGGIKVMLGGDNSKISIRNHERIVQAAALNADGNAGKILISANDVPMQAQIGTNNTVPTIVATGGSNSGEGGTVEIPHLRAVNNTAPDSEEILVNVATAIKVDGAPSRDPNIFDGQISINGVVCRQRHTPDTYWFTSAWNCVNPDSPTSEDYSIYDGAQLLNGTMATQLSNTLSVDNKRVQIYLMLDSNAFLRFVGGKQQESAYAAGYSQVQSRMSAVFVRTRVPQFDPTKSVFQAPTYGILSVEDAYNSPTIRKAAIIHELSHQLDFIWGHPSEGLFASKRPDAFAQLDAADRTTIWSPQRLSDNPSSSNTGIMQGFDTHIADTIDNRIGPNAIPNQVKHLEMFARIFTHHYRITDGITFQPELDNAYDTMQVLKDIVDPLIATPPAPVN